MTGAFEALVKGNCDYAVVPFENSTNGSVVFTLDILRDIFHQTSTDTASPIHVTEEIFVPINHCLISNATSLSAVKRLYTHPQAWGQCDVFTHKNFPGDIEKIDTNSTSAAVELVKDDPEGAAIAAAAAATVHDVPILAKNIANRANNTTRFLVFSRLPVDQPDTVLKYITPPKVPENAVTFASFIVPHDSPGALCNTLQELAKLDISLTSINSRPCGGMPWTYVFFIEFLGHISQSNVALALERAEKHCLEFVVLGSFPRSQAYHDSRNS